MLGHSGSGKSTLLRAIAGLEPLVAGSVLWDGASLDGVKTHKRNFGMVFQDAQLFPTMSVGKNVGYGLSKWSRAERDARVGEMLELVGLAGYGDRKITELSGGQAQRVALARSLAPTPRALLLDEPLSALDTGLRRRLADDLARILRETNTTAVYVTHDRDEAYAIADEVAVMADGRLLDKSDPVLLRSRPASRDVATFLGAQAFLTQAQARALGWDGELAVGEVLGVMPGSLVLDGDGVKLEILDQTVTVDDIQISVRLPEGSTAAVSSRGRVESPTVRVRLVDGAVVPA